MEPSSSIRTPCRRVHPGAPHGQLLTSAVHRIVISPYGLGLQETDPGLAAPDTGYSEAGALQQRAVLVHGPVSPAEQDEHRQVADRGAEHLVGPHRVLDEEQ